MFSAFKRLTGKGDSTTPSTSVPNVPPNHQAMSSSLQKRFARGVQYNMKIIIKGDRNVGKTCLFHRLQGKKFVEEYIPTEEIQVTSIQWNYKATDDVVKVEVWDVVDKGKKKRRFDGLKLDNTQLDLPEETALDAEFLDVYKGTNGVIIVMDITKTWTFEYVEREMPKIPGHIPVIILANHCDMAHHRTVTPDHITYYIESLEGQRTSQVRYSEASMRNGFGLKLLHKFFNLPFLQLQRETLIRQLERNEVEITATVQELDMFSSSEEADYNLFLDRLTQKRREIADSNANIPAPSNVILPKSVSVQQFKSSNSGNDVKRSQSASIIIGAGKPIPFGNVPGITAKNSGGNSQSSRSNSTAGNSTSTTGTGSSAATRSSRFTGQDDGLPDIRRLDISAIVSVDEFCPDGGQLDRSFLDDMAQLQTTAPGVIGGHINGHQGAAGDMSDDSDADTGNPLVSELQDDLEPSPCPSPDTGHPTSNPAQPTSTNSQPHQQQQHQRGIEPPNHFRSAISAPNLGGGNNTVAMNTATSAGGGGNGGDCIRGGSSDGLEMDVKNTPDELDSTINSEISEITSDAFDTWVGADSKWRRSPEGGEDVSAVNQVNDYSNSTVYDDTASVTSSNHLQVELLGSNRASGASSLKSGHQDSDGDCAQEEEEDEEAKNRGRNDAKREREKSEKKHKHKKSKHRTKDSNTSTSERKHRKREQNVPGRGSRDELEEFLNGSASPCPSAAYEAL